jgi:chemotaxis protein methyltransferase CheR
MSGKRDVAASIIEDPSYARLKDYLITVSGLAYYRDHDEYFAELIGRRLAKVGLNDCAAYSERLADGKAGRDELDGLIGDLTIGETYFFRDRQQFDAIRDVVIPAILDRNQSSKRLRIWSAGCANGAEPYSLAILLARELGHRLNDWHVSILATDISRQSLAEAPEGRFQSWALRATSPAIKDECFSAQGSLWTIHAEYKKWVTFAPLNLADSSFPPSLRNAPPFDLILCRNVMIYFAPDAIRRLILRFHQQLNGGGWFVAGAAEHSMDAFNCFEAVSLTGATVYRKSADQPPEAVAPPAIEPIYIRTGPASQIQPERTVPVGAGSEPGSIDELRRLADCGDWEKALVHCGRLLALDGMNPVVHFYRALLLVSMDRTAEAVRSLRQAIYLDRNFLLAHYHLGLVLARGNQAGLAARSFKNVLRLSGGVPDGLILENGDGLTAAGLKAMAEMHLRDLGDA